ncbi:MAG TPA: hypothetical protein VGB37_09015 [Candidatus Lokiarchaeia archaeon]
MTEKSIHFKDYLDDFGSIKFAENNSLNVGDFERAFKHYLKIVKRPRGKYKLGEIDNQYIRDFTSSFNRFFE